jgi:hypothetical protein
MQQTMTIKYQSGEEITVVAYPPDFAKWERAEKKSISEFGAIWDILFVAHSAVKREAGSQPTKPFDAWMESVVDVDLGSDNPKAMSVDQ